MWLLRRINSAAQSYECKHSTPVRQNCATLNSLHVKTATSHKFSAQRIVGKAFTGHTQEIFQEFQKSLGLVIFRFALVDLEQQRLCELLQYRQFIDQYGIEHRIRILLKRENILLLAPADRSPHVNRLSGSCASGSGIPYHTTQQSAVRSGNPVMFINIDIGQGADIYLVFAFLGKCIGGLLIQSVDSFNDQDIILSQLFEIAAFRS